MAVSDNGVFRKTSNEQDLEIGPCRTCDFGHLTAVRSTWKADIRNQKIYARVGLKDTDASWSVGSLNSLIAIFLQNFDDQHSYEWLIVDYKYRFAVASR